MLPDAREVMPYLDRATILAEARPFDPLTRLSTFSQRFPQEMQVLKAGGVHPTEYTPMNNPYTGEPNHESFSNVGEHCFAVGTIASVLAFQLFRKGVLSGEEVGLATSRGLVHDANKGLEIMRRNAAREGRFEGNVYTPNAYLTIVPLLKAQGLDPVLVDYIAGAGTETGHTSTKDFLVLSNGQPALVPGKMVEKIIHLADDMTSTSIPKPGERALTVYLTTWERMTASEFPSPRRYPFLWREGLGFDHQGTPVPVEDITEDTPELKYKLHYAYWQPYISNLICEEIQGIVDPQSRQKPEYFIKDLVNATLMPAILSETQLDVPRQLPRGERAVMYGILQQAERNRRDLRMLDEYGDQPNMAVYGASSIYTITEAFGTTNVAEVRRYLLEVDEAYRRIEQMFEDRNLN